MESRILTNDTPEPFGYKIGWLAIRSVDRDAIARALQLSDPREASWKAGIDAVYKDAYKLIAPASKLFVSPPVDGWTFVVGEWTMGGGDERGLRVIEDLVTRLSANFGEAQAFATYRVVDYHHWMFARFGSLVRSFAFVDGAPLANSGEPTLVEREFRWHSRLSEPHDKTADGGSPDDEDAWPNEEDVMQVAGAWSVNPQLLGAATPSAGMGLLATAPPALGTARQSGREPGRRPWWRFWG